MRSPVCSPVMRSQETGRPAGSLLGRQHMYSGGWDGGGGPLAAVLTGDRGQQRLTPPHPQDTTDVCLNLADVEGALVQALLGNSPPHPPCQPPPAYGGAAVAAPYNLTVGGGGGHETGTQWGGGGGPGATGAMVGKTRRPYPTPTRSTQTTRRFSTSGARRRTALPPPTTLLWVLCRWGWHGWDASSCLAWAPPRQPAGRPGASRG
jgi:hypothetical protein